MASLKALQNIRTQEDFELFFNLVTKQAEKLPVDKPHLKRKRKVPKYSILQYWDGQETTSKAHYPATVQDEFPQIYFDTLDHITNAIKERFDQPSFKAYANLEELLVKGAINQTSEVGKNQIKLPYSNEVDVSDLEVQFKVFKQMFKDPPECLNDVVEMFIRRDKCKKLLVLNIVSICKLLLVNPTTSATPECSFSSGCNIKTWKAPQRKPNNLMIYRFCISIRNLQTILIWLKSETSLQKSMRTEKVYLVNFLTMTLKFKKYLYILKYFFSLSFSFFSQHFFISNF